MPNKSLVVFRAPRVGLANMLITWSRAVAFAHVNDLPWKSYGWSAFRPGPWMRGEVKKRLYRGLFKSNMSLPKMAVTEFNIRQGHGVLFDPPIMEIDVDEKLIVFRKFPKGPDFFSDLQGYTELIKQEFNQLLSADVHQAAAKQEPVSIACHIRRGDFIAPGDPRYSVGGEYCQTPNEFFRDAILAIRRKVGEALPATIFSNGNPEQLAELLMMPGVSLAKPNSDMVDLLRMSRSQYLISSAWSSFNYLAGYLGEATMIRLPYPNSCRIRGSSTAAYEGSLEDFIYQPDSDRAAA